MTLSVSLSACKHEYDYEFEMLSLSEYLWCEIRKPTYVKKYEGVLQRHIEVVLLFHLRPLATWIYCEYENADKRFPSFAS